MFKRMPMLNASTKAGNARANKRKAASFAGLSIVAVVVAATCTLGLSSYAPAFANDVPQSDVDKLETKFFRHMYPKDSTTVRLDRLEKMVFGETKSGSDQERTAGLLKLVTEDDLKQASSGGSSDIGSSAPKKEPSGPRKGNVKVNESALPDL